MAYFHDSIGYAGLDNCGSKCSCGVKNSGLAERYFDEKVGAYKSLGSFGQPGAQVREITFPPIDITISRQKKVSILRNAGWIQANIIVTAKDYLGGPLTGYKLLAEFKAPSVATVTEGGDIRGGATSWANVWLKPEGSVRFLALALGRPSIVPEGIAFYKVTPGAPMRFQLTQRSREVTVTASNSEEALDKVGAKGNAGIDYKIISIGGELSAERERGRTSTKELSWKVILPTAVFDVAQM